MFERRNICIKTHVPIVVLLELLHGNLDLLTNDENSIFGSQPITLAMLFVDIDQVDGRRVIFQQSKAWTTTNSSRNMEFEVSLPGLLLSGKGTI